MFTIWQNSYLALAFTSYCIPFTTHTHTAHRKDKLPRPKIRAFNRSNIFVVLLYFLLAQTNLYMLWDCSCADAFNNLPILLCETCDRDRDIVIAIWWHHRRRTGMAAERNSTFLKSKRHCLLNVSINLICRRAGARSHNDLKKIYIYPCSI